jgi:signal transduction histidine kinase
MQQKFLNKKIILLNRDLQFKYMRMALIIGSLTTVLNITLILYPLYKFKILHMAQFLPMPIIATMAIAAVLNILTIGILSIYLTHKIAGPMYNLCKHMRNISLGKIPKPIAVRKDDDLKYVVRNFNEMTKNLSKDIGKDITKINEILEYLIKSDGLKDEYKNLLIEKINQLKEKKISKLELL